MTINVEGDYINRARDAKEEPTPLRTKTKCNESVKCYSLTLNGTNMYIDILSVYIVIVDIMTSMGSGSREQHNYYDTALCFGVNIKESNRRWRRRQ